MNIYVQCTSTCISYKHVTMYNEYTNISDTQSTTLDTRITTMNNENILTCISNTQIIIMYNEHTNMSDT